ncbi:MAG: hypothetical protein HY806_01675 [Nitrospirae bacterium]|nr:hypothetical protein [Nitrospirota bacterium]
MNLNHLQGELAQAQQVRGKNIWSLQGLYLENFRREIKSLQDVKGSLNSMYFENECNPNESELSNVRRKASLHFST